IRDGHVTGVQTCALPICERATRPGARLHDRVLLGNWPHAGVAARWLGGPGLQTHDFRRLGEAVGSRGGAHAGRARPVGWADALADRKSTRLNSSHVAISY